MKDDVVELLGVTDIIIVVPGQVEADLQLVTVLSEQVPQHNSAMEAMVMAMLVGPTKHTQPILSMQVLTGLKQV